MRAWEQVAVPSLRSLGAPAPVRVHDTATGRPVTVDPAGTARLYVCGITPYDATHLGHAATYLAFDLLNRAWRDAGHDVRYVQNVTDVDDPLLERARQTGADWEELARRETDRFRDDMAALRVIPPDFYVGAVESIDVVVDLVQRLRDRGAVYDVDGDLYFSVHADPAFGRVSGLGEAAMRTLFGERGGDPDRPGKKHPLDCLLWQAPRHGEPSWPSALGPGRPGWHVECSAIALAHLGETFDVQGGGSDLVFPHHEMSASEAQVVTEAPFATAYVHAGMVGYQGEKMSKSRGNLVLVSRLRRDGVPPAVLRLALLGHHYRSDWEWTGADLARADARLSSWRSALPHAGADEAAALVCDVREALADDLDTPSAVAAVDAWAAGSHGDGSGAAVVRDLLDARLGLVW
jgi:L-cysteine:1D-myo-inositol 2-amino-2-deoxy-alpha-D-glucopyranoside ligase